jgi:hypothetical protein
MPGGGTLALDSKDAKAFDVPLQTQALLGQEVE